MDNNDFQEAVGVVIYTSPELQTLPHMREVLYGLEEEEIPFFIRNNINQSHSMVSFAFRAAAQSAFGVGICFTQNSIIIHHQNLKREEPLFYISRDQCTLNQARLIGTNAARLVKGVPFEEI